MTDSRNTAAFIIASSPVQTLRRSIAIDAPFERFTEALKKILGHFPSDFEQELSTQPQRAEQRIKAAAGALALMIVAVFDHGAALNLNGARRNAKLYLIGNPLTAISMLRHDIRAALYAPLRVLVYEPTAGQTAVEYDLPSSLFGQFEQSDVTHVALTVDEELEHALAQAAELSHQ
jgi:uncharacterized protein (DUF302 family)